MQCLTLAKNLVYCQCSSRKYPYLHNTEVIFSNTSPPLWKFLVPMYASYIIFFGLIHRTPHPPGNSNPFCGRSIVDIFWKVPHIILLSTEPVQSTHLYTAVATKVVPQSAKAYATMLIGLMGKESLALID